MAPADVHPPGRRRLRSAVRDDGYETWTIADEQYGTLRAFILDTVEDLDLGCGNPTLRAPKFPQRVRLPE